MPLIATLHGSRTSVAYSNGSGQSQSVQLTTPASALAPAGLAGIALEKVIFGVNGTATFTGSGSVESAVLMWTGPHGSGSASIPLDSLNDLVPELLAQPGGAPWTGDDLQQYSLSIVAQVFLNPGAGVTLVGNDYFAEAFSAQFRVKVNALAGPAPIKIDAGMPKGALQSEGAFGVAQGDILSRGTSADANVKADA